MNTTAELPAWRIIPTPEGQFRWSPSNGNVPPLAAERLKIPIPRRTTPGSPLLLSISKLSSEGEGARMIGFVSLFYPSLISD